MDQLRFIYYLYAAAISYKLGRFFRERSWMYDQKVRIAEVKVREQSHDS